MRHSPGRLWRKTLASLRPLSLIRQQALETEIDDELRFHLEMRMQDNLTQGMSPAQALADAQQRFGNVAHIKDECLRVQAEHPLRVVAVSAAWQSP